MTYFQHLSLALLGPIVGATFSYLLPPASPDPGVERCTVVVLAEVADLQHGDRLQGVAQEEHGAGVRGVDDAHDVVFDLAVTGGGGERVLAGGSEREDQRLTLARRESLVDSLCGGIESQPVHPPQPVRSGGAA